MRSLTVTGTFSDASTFVVNFGTTFVSSAPAVATVGRDTGYVTAVAAGTATITATHADSGKTATTTVSVSPLRVLSIAVSPASSTLAPGATLALSVTGTYNNGTTGPETTRSTFVSSHPAVAVVDAAGVVTAIAAGTATITATHTASGKTGTATVVVSVGGGGGDGAFTDITFDSAGVAYTLTGFGGAEDSTLVPDPTNGSNVVATGRQVVDRRAVGRHDRIDGCEQLRRQNPVHGDQHAHDGARVLAPGRHPGATQGGRRRRRHPLGRDRGADHARSTPGRR